MNLVLIDIDKLLESTSDLTSEKKATNPKALIEIDQLLDRTREW